MKRIAIALVLTLVAFAATSGFAQIGSLHFTVQFGFSVDGRPYPAGSYELRTISSGTGELRQLRNLKTGDSGFIVLDKPIRPAVGASGETPKLTFVVSGRYGYLTSLADSANTWSVHIAERDWERLGQSTAKETIIVALK